jgi:hypothetical protein
MVIEDSDNLVASYDSFDELRIYWKRDVLDFLEYNGVKTDWSSDIHPWYPYFTREDDNGDIDEISSSEVLEGVA